MSLDELAELIRAERSVLERFPDPAARAAFLAAVRRDFPARPSPLDALAPPPVARTPLPGAGARLDAPPAVCIVTPDLAGPIKNGGIGTAYARLAAALAA